MFKVKRDGKLKETASRLVVFAIIMQVCIPLQADIAGFPLVNPQVVEDPFDVTMQEMINSPNFKALANRIFIEDVVAPTTFFKLFKYVKYANLTLEEVPWWGKLIGRATFIGEAKAVYDAFSIGGAVEGAFEAKRIEDDAKTRVYHGALWENFLNDPLYLGPSPYDPNNSYIRDVFSRAAKLVNDALDRTHHDCCINPKRIFLSESFESYFQIRDEGNSKKIAYFFVPATAFFVGDFNEKVNKVAISLASQLASFSFFSRKETYRKELFDIMDGHLPDGRTRWKFAPADFTMTIDGAVRLWATQLLRLPDPDFKKDEFQTFKEDFDKYVIETTPTDRNIFHRHPRTEPAYVKNVLSFRPQRMATSKGPLTGEMKMTHCSIDGVEAVIGRNLDPCLALPLSLMSKDAKDYVYKKLSEVHEKNSKSLAEDPVAFTSAMLTATFFEFIIGKTLNKAGLSRQQLGNVKFIRNGALKYFIAPAVAWTIGTKGTRYAFKQARSPGNGVDIEETSFANDPNLSPLEQILLKLNAGSMTSDHVGDGVGDGFQMSMNQAYLDAQKEMDPDLIEIFTKLAR